MAYQINKGITSRLELLNVSIMKVLEPTPPNVTSFQPNIYLLVFT